MDEDKKTKWWQKSRLFSYRLPKLSMKIPNASGIFTALRMPYLSKVRFNINNKKSLSVGFVAIALGVGMTIFISIEATTVQPVFPEPGVYTISDNGLQWDAGQKNVNYTYVTEDGVVEEPNMTLQLLFSGRIQDIDLQDLNLGKTTGLTEVIKVENFICEKMTVEGVEVGQLIIENSKIYQFNSTNNVADGITTNLTMSTTPSNIVVGSSRNAVTPKVTNSMYDRVILSGTASPNQPYCKSITLKNINSYGANNKLHINNVQLGTLDVKTNLIGVGDGINIADYKVLSTTVAFGYTGSGDTEKQVAVK